MRRPTMDLVTIMSLGGRLGENPSGLALRPLSLREDALRSFQRLGHAQSARSCDIASASAPAFVVLSHVLIPRSGVAWHAKTNQF